MLSIENIALKVVNSMEINIIHNRDSNYEESNNYDYCLNINKLNVNAKYPSSFYLDYSTEIQIRVNNLIKRNIDKIIQQKVFEILNTKKS